MPQQGRLIRERLEKGIEVLQELGLKINFGQSVYRQSGYLAGSDLERVDDLHRMFADQEVKAIFCARGGYGSARIASKINYQLIQSNPKIFWGYSDITFLHVAMIKRAGLVPFHGPMIASDLGKEEVCSLTKQAFEQLFRPVTLNITKEQSSLTTIIAGTASGPLVGGNLTLLTSTLGTPFEIDTTGKILMIEEINEEPRAIDRMLNQLDMAGKLNEAAGVVLGDFHECHPKTTRSFELDEVLEEYIKRWNKPAIKGMTIGHCSPNLAVPLGVNAFLDASNNQLSVESGVLP